MTADVRDVLELSAYSVTLTESGEGMREIIARAGGLEGEIGDIVEHAVKPGGI